MILLHISEYICTDVIYNRWGGSNVIHIIHGWHEYASANKEWSSVVHRTNHQRRGKLKTKMYKKNESSFFSLQKKNIIT